MRCRSSSRHAATLLGLGIVATLLGCGASTKLSVRVEADKDANAGQSPAMVGDRQKIARPPAPQIASTAVKRPAEQRSGMETALGSLADQMHPPKRR